MQIARHGAIELAYETFGFADGEPLLLISGTGVQMLMWPDAFVAALAGRGFCVTRFDNRDAGLSTHLTEAGNPGWLKPLIRHAAAPYRLEDMADDAVAVLDALNWDSAHIVGASLGGMIAQTMAIRAPIARPHAHLDHVHTLGPDRHHAEDLHYAQTDADRRARRRTVPRRQPRRPWP